MRNIFKYYEREREKGFSIVLFFLINLTDVNECNQGICSQECHNSVGSFECTCFPGYVLNEDKITCSGEELLSSDDD